MSSYGAPALARILALARAGALEPAWALFETAAASAGAGRADLETVRARLIKDKAARASGEERRQLYRQAAAAYSAAAAETCASYPLINAATLSLLSGDLEAARSLGAEVLHRLQNDPDEPETPYWLAATRAEALLLLDRNEEARTALAEAVAVAPRAWEDHASTLRQFALILSEQGRSATWIDSLRPPRSLHFGGHMAFRAEGSRPELESEIASVLEHERVGFAFGALAAGADIIIAEALLARGAELHLLLAGGREAFAARSVEPFGRAWRGRYDAVVAQAESVRAIRPLGAAPTLEAISLADEIAMGGALMNARRLESEAVQLLVMDGSAGDMSRGPTAAARQRWADGGWRQRLLAAPRDSVGYGDHLEGAPPATAVAVLAVAVEGEGQPRLDALADHLRFAAPPSVAPYWSCGQVLIGYANCTEATKVARQLAQHDYRVGCDYLVASPFSDPFSGQRRLSALTTTAAAAAAASTPSGTACVTEDFASALTAREPRLPAVEPVGELDAASDGPIALYALLKAS